MNPVRLEIVGQEVITPWGEVSGVGPVVLVERWLVGQLLRDEQAICPSGNRLLGLGTARVSPAGELRVGLNLGSVTIVYDLHPALMPDGGHVYVGVRREMLDESAH